MAKNGQLFLSDLLGEEDFKNVRTLPWFLALIEEAKMQDQLERNIATYDYA